MSNSQPEEEQQPLSSSNDGEDYCCDGGEHSWKSAGFDRNDEQWKVCRKCGRAEEA